MFGERGRPGWRLGRSRVQIERGEHGLHVRRDRCRIEVSGQHQRAAVLANQRPQGQQLLFMIVVEIGFGEVCSDHPDRQAVDRNRRAHEAVWSQIAEVADLRVAKRQARKDDQVAGRRHCTAAHSIGIGFIEARQLHEHRRPLQNHRHISVGGKDPVGDDSCIFHIGVEHVERENPQLRFAHVLRRRWRNRECLQHHDGMGGEDRCRERQGPGWQVGGPAHRR